MATIILASASPRRAELLQQIGLDFEIVVSGVPEEDVQENDPVKLAERLALAKADAVSSTLRDQHALVIAADTVVCADGKLLGKPVDKPDAMRMLRLLSD